MKIIFIFASVSILSFLFLSCPVYSQEKVGQTRVIQEWGYNNVGTKGWGIGGAFVGQADDISAFFWNPAGLTQLEKTNIYTEFFFKAKHKFYDLGFSSKSIQIQVLQLGYKYKRFAFSLGYTKSYNLSFDGYLVETSYFHPLDEEPYGNHQIKFKTNDSVNQYNFTCAFQLNKNISLGTTIFYNHYKFSDEFDGDWLTRKGNSFSTIFGILLRANNYIRCGLSIMPQSRVGWEYSHNGYAFEPNEDRFPTRLRFGLSVSPLYAFNINFDIQTTFWDAVYNYLDDKTDFYFGMEKKINSNFYLRTGAYTKLAIHDDSWYDDSYFLTLGFGLSINPININLSLQDNQILSRLIKGREIELEQTFIIASVNYNF